MLNYIDCTIRQHQQILNLRNDDSVRCEMVNTSTVEQSEHFQFVNRLISDPSRLYYAVFEDNVLLATINYTEETEEEWERGIIASPIIQGKNVTSKIEQLVNAQQKTKGIKRLTAKVRNSNARSMRYHTKMGYCQTGIDNDYTYYKLDL